MRVHTVLYGIVAFAALTVIAAPIAQEHSLAARLSFGSLGKTAGKTTSSSTKGSTTKTGTTTGTSSTTKSSGGLLNKIKGIFGFGSKPSPTVAATTPKATTAAPPATTAAPPATTATPKATTAATTSPATTTATPTSKPATTSSTTTSSSATTSETAESCALYTASDLIHLSTRDMEELERRAGEEYWFRFEDPSITTGANILSLAARAGGKDFDDQAYKWISMDASKVQRGSIRGRLPTLYVMPSGTRARVQAAAQDFEESRDASTAQDFVTKDNEPGDVGIQGVRAAADGKIPLDTFRDQILRVVTVQTNKKNKQFFTVKVARFQRLQAKLIKLLWLGSVP
ncbi:hypothetical protein DL96DRAFT_1572563, partial [Flagelloscypha sp. PMI_526]